MKNLWRPPSEPKDGAEGSGKDLLRLPWVSPLALDSAPGQRFWRTPLSFSVALGCSPTLPVALCSSQLLTGSPLLRCPRDKEDREHAVCPPLLLVALRRCPLLPVAVARCPPSCALHPTVPFVQRIESILQDFKRQSLERLPKSPADLPRAPSGQLERLKKENKRLMEDVEMLHSANTLLESDVQLVRFCCGLPLTHRARPMSDGKRRKTQADEPVVRAHRLQETSRHLRPEANRADGRLKQIVS